MIQTDNVGSETVLILYLKNDAIHTWLIKNLLIIITFVLIGTLAFSVSIGSYNLYLADNMRGKSQSKNLYSNFTRG